jgi:hypothetical protein
MLAKSLVSRPLPSFLAKRSYHKKDLRVFDMGAEAAPLSSISNIECTLFGGSSMIGLFTAQLLTQMGSRCVLPHRYMTTIYNSEFKEIKSLSNLGYKASLMLNDFEDQKELNLALRNMNSVVCCIGSKFKHRTLEQYEEANIRIPIAIAKAVKNNTNIKRYAFLLSFYYVSIFSIQYLVIYFWLFVFFRFLFWLVFYLLGGIGLLCWELLELIRILEAE